MNLPPNLCYTLALDQPGQDFHRQMARLLVTSLLRTGWHGRIVVFRNQLREVLPEGHPDVEEIVLDSTAGVRDRPMTWKYRVRDRLNLTGISKVLFLDCDCLALRSINHLMLGSWDIYTAPEPFELVQMQFNGYFSDEELTSLRGRRGLNAGNLGIRAEHFLAVNEEWERIDRTEQLRSHHPHLRDQHSWNRLILDTSLRHRDFAAGEIQFPFLDRATYLDYRRASILHVAGQGAREKLAFMFGAWMEAFGLGRLEELTKPA